MSINRDFSKFPNVITAAGDAKILNMTAADITYDGVSLLGGGGGSTDTTERKLEVDATSNSYVHEFMFRATGQYTAWTTLKTISRVGGLTGTFASGIVSATLVGVVNNNASGSRQATWAWRTSGDAPFVELMNTDVSTGAGANFQLNVNGSTVEAQVRGDDGTNTFTGSIHLVFYIPNSGTLTIT